MGCRVRLCAHHRVAAVSPWEDALRRNEPQAIQGMHRLFLHMRTIDDLTPRETEILDLASYGYTQQQVADILGIGRETVRMFEGTMRRKIGAINRPHAVAIGLRRGIIT